MKNADTMLQEYVNRLNDDELKFLFDRYSQLLCGDRAEISNFLSKNKEIDRWLGTASGSFEFFNMVDEIGEIVKEVHGVRFKTLETK
ncbi:MAG: hypothetical protein DWQ19_11080 [Crenarchaeota archaeon]|mgnify:CR=1 FL=1|nr:MAG: hypothetical protein DWQ19_11080 [Thermoproteota archaeon]